MKKNILLALWLGSSLCLHLNAGESGNSQGRDMFLYGSIGASYLDVKKDVSSLAEEQITPGAFDDRGAHYAIGLGYYLDPNTFVSYDAQLTKLSKLKIVNIGTSLNYQWSELAYRPYIGLAAGYSTLTWSQAPYPALINEDLTSRSFYYGAQMGMEKRLTEVWSLTASYQYLFMDHRIDIYSSSAYIEHKNTNQLSIGVKYAF